MNLTSGALELFAIPSKQLPMNDIADTPEPPYYAVIFSNIQSDDLAGYAEMAALMERLAKQQPGYLGFESARNELGIAISYWKDLDSIKSWKANVDHEKAQKLGRSKWYTQYKTRIALVERDYDQDR